MTGRTTLVGVVHHGVAGLVGKEDPAALAARADEAQEGGGPCARRGGRRVFEDGARCR